MKPTSYRWSLIGIAIGIVALGALLTRTQPSNAQSGEAIASASLHSDKPDYTPGETATLTGAGFQSLEPIELHITIEQPVTGAQVGQASFDPFNASDGGGFAVEYVVPGEADGMTMRATASGTDSGLTATAILNNPAWLETDMDNYPPNAVVYITGGGFYAGETVQLQVLHVGEIASEGLLDEHTDSSDDGEGHETWTVQADENGVLVDVTWTICEDDCAGALLEITATGQDSGLSATARFADPTVATNKDDYQPGDYVVMTGSGWLPYSTVTLTVDSDCGCTHEVFTATVDENGDFENSEFLIEEKHLGARFLLTAEGQDAQGNPASARTTFTDAVLTLYVDSARTIQQTAFPWSATVYAQGTGITAGRCGRIEWFQPGNATPVETDEVVANASGIINADYIISGTGPSGIWSARVQNGGKVPPCDGSGYTTTGQQTQVFDVARAVVIGAGSASTATADNPGGDNLVAQGTPTTVQGVVSGVNGVGNLLAVDSRNALAKRTFLTFDLAGLPSSATITDATLRFWITGFPGGTNCTTPRTYELQRAGATWGEGSITWNSALALGVSGNATAVSVPGFSTGVSSFLRIGGTEVRNDVQSLLAGNNFGWRLKDQVETIVSTTCFTNFASTENTNVQQRPVLLVDYTTNVCGNGIVEGPETCDDSNTTTETTCPYGQPTCALCNATCSAVLNLTGPYCGDTAVNGPETCDDGNTTTETTCPYGQPTCTLCDATCSNPLSLTGPYCGDNAVNGPEVCDDGNTTTETTCPYGTPTCAPCNATCSTVLSLTGPYCGDGTTNGPEQCDLAAANGSATACCTATCTYSADDYVCRPGADQCDADETCTGASSTCPTDLNKPDGTSCDDESACTEDDSCTAGDCAGDTIDCDDDDTCSIDSCNVSTGCVYECVEQTVSIEYKGDRFVSTSGPTVGSAQVVLAAKITPDTTEYCGDLTDLQVRFRVYAQKDLAATPVADFTVGVNSNGEAVKLVSLTVGNSPYTVRATIVGDECWSEDYDDACLTVDYGSTERRVTGGGFVPSLLSRNEKSNFGFTVGFNKNGTLKGNSIYMVRGTDGYNYLVKSTAWTGGELTFTKDGTGKLSRARFSGKGVIQKLDPNTGALVSSTGNVTFIVDLFDGDLYTPKQRDQYAIRVILQNGTQWFGSSATLQQLGGGNVQIFASK